MPSRFAAVVGETIRVSPCPFRKFWEENKQYTSSALLHLSTWGREQPKNEEEDAEEAAEDRTDMHLGGKDQGEFKGSMAVLSSGNIPRSLGQVEDR